MKKLMNWVLAVALICGANVLTSCSESGDNPSPENSKDRKEFIEHTRQSLKTMAENLNFTTLNSFNYMNTYLNQCILLNDDFDKTISRAFGQKIQESLKSYEKPEGVDPADLPDYMQKDFKYVATVDLTDFNYTFTATTTGFDMAENDDQGLVVEMPVYGTSEAEGVKIAIKNYEVAEGATATSSLSSDGKIGPVNDHEAALAWKIKAPKAGNYQLVMVGKCKSDAAEYTLAERAFGVKLNGAEVNVDAEERIAVTTEAAPFVAAPTIALSGPETEDVIAITCTDYRIQFDTSSFLLFQEI